MESIHQKGQSQKLLRCKVISKDGEESERFVEMEHFKLWSYMMFHKHGLKIKDISLWLWLEKKEYLGREEIYLRATEKLEVKKLEVFLFDELNGFSHVIHRYALSNEAPKIEKILFNHLAPELITSGNYEITVHEGYCVKHEMRNVDKLVLGLSEKDERIWYRER